MKRNITKLIFLLGSTLLFSCVSTAKEFQMRSILTTTQDSLAVRFVSVEDIKKSLMGSPPLKVAFDVDDTVLASSPIFFYGKAKYSPEDYSYLKNQDFWDEINTGLDIKFSIPKESARKLIAMHRERGDQIYFITARTAPNANGPAEKVTEAIYNAFGAENLHPVIFSGGTEHETEYDKTPFMQELGIAVYYGDSDSDILAAREAGARAIRIIRGAGTTYLPMPINGKLGEEIVINSHF